MALLRLPRESPPYIPANPNIRTTANIPFSAAEWAEKVENSKDAIVVDFFAEWCGPCKAIAPRVEQFALANENVKFYKVDVDKLAEVAADNGISAMPTFLFFKDGKKLDANTVRGANPPAIEAGVKAVAA